MVRVALNGFGRIGRMFVRLIYDIKNNSTFEREKVEIVAINDLGSLSNFVYLLKYDSVYGKFDQDIKVDGNNLIVGNKVIKFFQERDPAKLPWKDLNIDVAIEATGMFESFEKASVHLASGAKRVVLSAPAKDEDKDGFSKTVLLGVNEEELKTCVISSNGSCTTNSAHPILEILNNSLGIQKAILTTVHSYTTTQRLADSPEPGDFRRGRAAAYNMVPSTTGAAIAVTKAVKELKGLFDGVAIRVPTICGSISEITLVSKKQTTVAEVNSILKKAETDQRWSKIFKTITDPVVSSDIIGEPFASIADLSFTKVVGGDLVQILAWYDNELGYTNSLIGHVIKAGEK